MANGAGLTGEEALAHLTDPEQAGEFVQLTGCDALAVAIGTSHGAYKFTKEPTGDILRIDPDVERAQVERVRSLRERRDQAAWKETLDALEHRARSGENVVPAIVDAVLALATVGEVSHALREIFGEHQETVVI